MKTYLIQSKRRKISQILVVHSVVAETRKEAMQQFALGNKEEVSEHVESDFNSDILPEIINESTYQPTLMENENENN